MDNFINNKNILISGGTTGIGRATAILLSQSGAKVFIYGRDVNALNATLETIKKTGAIATGCVADQTKIEDIKKVFAEFDAQFGNLDILINNASVGARSISETTLEDMEYIVKANLLGYMYCSRLALDRMRKIQSGHIIMVGSMCTQVFDEGASVYVATKTGVLGLARSLRKEINNLGIKVTLIESGNVGTDMVTEGLNEQLRLQEEGIMLKPEDIAQAILFCVSQPSRTDILSVQLKPRNQKF